MVLVWCVFADEVEFEDEEREPVDGDRIDRRHHDEEEEEDGLHLLNFYGFFFSWSFSGLIRVGFC